MNPGVRSFYQMAGGLCGVYRDRREEASCCATIDLDKLTLEPSSDEAQGEEGEAPDRDVEEAA